MISQVLLVGLGGFLGATFRFGIGHYIKSNIQHAFPFSTLLVNALGCFILGLFLEYFKTHHLMEAMTLFFVIGFLGAFTTFSAFGFETIQLFQIGYTKLAALNILVNLSFSFLAILIGTRIATVFH